MSGSNVTFLFPDHTTAMTGTFSKSEMFLGQVSFIQVSDDTLVARPVSVLIVGLSYGARNVLSYIRYMIQNVLAFKDGSNIPIRRSPQG